MKKIIRITSVILSIALCLVVATGTTVRVKAATPTDILYDGGMYRIRNVATGLYLTAYNGTDANGTNVVQQPLNTSSNAQKWVISWGVLEGFYLYSMCSGNGYGRVLDIARGSSNLANGQNVQLWTSTDATAQSWDIYAGNTSMSAIFIPRHNDNIALCAYGTGSGSTGTSPTSNGNVFMRTYNETDKYQQWYLEYLGQAPTTPYMTISAMTTKFPTDKYWNHGTAANNPNGYTSAACTSHSSCAYNGSCGCNSYESSIQCVGFVKKLSYDIYHDSYLTGNWLKSYEQSYLENVRKGDIIYRNGHAMMVENVDHSQSKITVLECNYNAKCIIDRRRTINFDTTITWVARSPFLWY
ncbi:MAG: hypothetical protein E7539_06775 [Ruminococcaceae bacterium]|nr:hypothetical protein [Oscillospiraceae bacterium]